MGKTKSQKNSDKYKDSAAGFSLVEVVIAMLILMIALLGVFISFAYAVNYNAGNNSRSQALAILQQEVENIRSAKFTPAVTDSKLLGGTGTPTSVTGHDGNEYIIRVTVDDNPNLPGIQIDNSQTLKEISVTVGLDTPTPGWQTAVPARIVLQRVRSN